MAGTAQIVIDLDSDLREAFLDAARGEDRPPSDIVREFILGYVSALDTTSSYDAFLERKVAKARESIRAGRSVPNDEVEAHFAKKRTAIMSGDA